MYVLKQKFRDGMLVRIMSSCGDGELAYLSLRLTWPLFEIELPTMWHEKKRAWIRFGLLYGVFGLSVPWPKQYPDYSQCCGPIYGFSVFDGGIHLHYGQQKGLQGDPFKIIYPSLWIKRVLSRNEHSGGVR